MVPTDCILIIVDSGASISFFFGFDVHRHVGSHVISVVARVTVFVKYCSNRSIIKAV
jgi:hypothetical protein